MNGHAAPTGADLQQVVIIAQLQFLAEAVEFEGLRRV